MSMKMPASFMSSFGWNSPMNPRKPVRKISGIKIKTTPTPITALSITQAKKRTQKPAYSTRGTTAYPANAGMAAPPPPKVVAADAPIIGTLGGTASTPTACPQVDQNPTPPTPPPPPLHTSPYSSLRVRYSSPLGNLFLTLFTRWAWSAPVPDRVVATSPQPGPANHCLSGKIASINDAAFAPEVAEGQDVKMVKFLADGDTTIEGKL